jgi:hypothetical protein
MNSENEPDTLVLVGSGAVCLSHEGIAHFDDLAQKTNVLTEFIGKSTTWRVFFHAFENVPYFKNQQIPKNISNDTSKSIEFLYDQFKLRYFSVKRLLYHLLITEAKKGENIDEKYTKPLESIPALRTQMAEQFNKIHFLENLPRKGQHGIALRTEGIDGQMIQFMGQSSVIATTNWDHALENHLGVAESKEHQDRIIHLHGNFQASESIFLPLDNSSEFIFLHKFLSHLSHGLASLELHKINQILPPLKVVENWTIVKLPILKRSWKRIVVWGLSLNAEDLELASLLDTVINGFSDELRQLIIINPDASHRDRIARLFRVPAEKRIDIDPTVPCKTTFKL